MDRRSSVEYTTFTRHRRYTHLYLANNRVNEAFYEFCGMMEAAIIYEHKRSE